MRHLTCFTSFPIRCGLHVIFIFHFTSWWKDITMFSYKLENSFKVMTSSYFFVIHCRDYVVRILGPINSSWGKYLKNFHGQENLKYFHNLCKGYIISGSCLFYDISIGGRDHNMVHVWTMLVCMTAFSFNSNETFYNNVIKLFWNKQHISSISVQMLFFSRIINKVIMQ